MLHLLRSSLGRVQIRPPRVSPPCCSFSLLSRPPPPSPLLSSSPLKRGASFEKFRPSRFKIPPQPTFLQRLSDLISYHPELIIGMAAGGMIATSGGIVYYMHQKNMIEKLLSKTDRIRLERAESEGGMSVPLPVLTFIGWALFGVLAAVLTRTKANLDLNFRQFGSRVNFSLNSVADGELKFRTVMEKSLDSVLMGNAAANAMVRSVVKKVTEADPFLKFPPTHNFFMMTAIINELSSLSSTAFFQADRRMPVERVKYIFALTFEKNAPFKKLRVQIVAEDLLQTIPPSSSSSSAGPLPVFEEHNHGDRWDTLRKMAAIYRDHGFNNSSSCLWRVEMAIPHVLPAQPHETWAAPAPASAPAPTLPGTMK